jgi:hypothetical protein
MEFKTWGRRENKDELYCIYLDLIPISRIMANAMSY